MECARQLDKLLRVRGAPFAFMGGLAINAWSIPVPTYDIDVCADLPEELVPPLLRELESEGYVPPAADYIESVGKARFAKFRFTGPFREV